MIVSATSTQNERATRASPCCGSCVVRLSAAMHEAQRPRPSTRVVHSPQISSLHDTQTPTASRSGWFWHPARTPSCTSSRDRALLLQALLR